jgi:hypothetical protein
MPVPMRNLRCRGHRLRFALLLIASVVLLWGTVRAQTSACTTDAVDKEKVADTMRQMYVAATNDDMALFHRVAATDFYAFDGGHRFTGDALMDLIPISPQGRQTLCLDSERTGGASLMQRRLDHLYQSRFCAGRVRNERPDVAGVGVSA